MLRLRLTVALIVATAWPVSSCCTPTELTASREEAGGVVPPTHHVEREAPREMSAGRDEILQDADALRDRPVERVAPASAECPRLRLLRQSDRGRC
jgi:hypothetical protein